MAVKERSQIKGTDAQIKAFAGHNGVLAFATDTKSLHVLSGTAGTTTEFLPSNKVATKTELDGKLSLSGGTMTGTLVVANGNNSITGNETSAYYLQINADGNSGGGQIRLYGKDNAQYPGWIFLYTKNGDAPEKALVLKGTGGLEWDGKPVLCGESGGFPVGFLALYAGSNVPDGWFRCDGSTIADMATNYPKLYAVLGTNVLPNYTGRTIYGASSDINQAVASGLPNITGRLIGNAGTSVAWLSFAPTGSFTGLNGEGNISKGIFDPSYTYPIENSYGAQVVLDASRASAVYGRSTDVQPPAVKTAVLIRHD